MKNKLEGGKQEILERFLRQNLEKVLSRGTDLPIDLGEKKRGYSVNIVLLFFGFISFCTFLFVAILGYYYIKTSGILVFLFFASWTMLYMRKFGFIELSRVVCLSLPSVMLAYFSSISEFYIGFSTAYCVVLIFTFWLYSPQDTKKRNVQIGFITILFIITIFRLIPNPQGIELWGENSQIVNKFFAAKTFGVVIWAIWYFFEKTKKREGDLKDSADLLKEAQDIARIGNWSYVFKDKEWIWSDEIYEIFRFDKSRKVTTDEYFGLIHPVDRMKVKTAFEKVLEEPGNLRMEHRFFTGDQEERVLLSICKPIKNERGEVYMLRGVMQDITEERMAQQALEESEKLFRTLYEFSPIGIGFRGQAGRITRVNPALERILGYSDEEIIGKRMDDFTPEEDRGKSGALIKNALMNGDDLLEYEGRYLHKNGSLIWVKVGMSFVRNSRSRLQYAILFIQDITENKNAESALISARDVAEQATRAKSDFLSTMSHEIRTPLNAVIGMTGLLADTHLTEEQVEYVSTVKMGGENLLSVINDILDYSKIESGKMDLEEIDFSVADPVEDSLDLLASKAHDKGIELISLIEREVPRVVSGDLTRIRQILVNLVGNAIKFTDQGEIIVRVKNNEKTESGYELLFSVKDTGIGIPLEKQTRLFQSFSQVDSSTTRKYGGTGLGLAICRKLVHLMGGDIWIESAEGEGTTFFFTIQAKYSDKKTEEVSGEYESSSYEHKILLVDDNPINIDILKIQCESMGLVPVATLDPKEALKKIQEKEEFDLVILDMHMPGMNGVELTQSIRTHKSEEELPVIMLTSVAELASSDDRALFSSFLTKPVRRRTLSRVIKKSLGNKVEIAPAFSSKGNDGDVKPNVPKIKILLAEDNAINQKVALRILGKLGFSADLAGNGLEAVEAMEMIAYDLILMDMQMPEMDGLEATRAIRTNFEQKGEKGPIIIAMTANAMKEERDMCIEAGMDDFLAKPVKVALLKETLLKWFPIESPTAI